jgi:FkbH-like protein
MLIDLEWLPAPAEDFRARVRALEAELAAGAGPGFLERVTSLAQAALDDSQLGQLARLARAMAARPPAGIQAIKLGLVGDGTLTLTVDPIIGSGLRHGLAIEVTEGGYNSGLAEAMDPESALRTAGLDFALLAPDARILGLDRAAVSEAEAEARVEAAFSHLRRIADHLRPSVGSAILAQTVAPPLDSLFGSYDRTFPGSPFAMAEALNRKIAAWAAEGAVVLVDIARWAGAVGLETWEEPRHWHASKLSVPPAMLPLYGDIVARTIGALRGKARKCLVLDLDNTLWAGVIGDDGLAGIALGQGSPVGEAFIAIQRMALELRARGVVLAVCSKNEEDAARLPFREHPDMLLREDHIAVFQANWTDKAANLKAIAETLNIGVDALVFLDDNPAERMQVRRALPLVGVPELPDDPDLYPRALAAAGYFEAVAFSDEDRQRAEFYQANAQRAAALSATGDMNDYLASLDMVCTIGPVDAVSRARTAQLINKSNQFNLTTRRYTEGEVMAAEQNPARHAIQIRLTDRFGDNGLISVIIADKRGEAWEIDTWLMSCRVLGRRVEQAALAHLASAARAEGARALIGRYLPTAKNRMVAEHYAKLGFERVAAADDGATTWRFDLAGYEAPDLPMRIIDTALATAGAAA